MHQAENADTILSDDVCLEQVNTLLLTSSEDNLEPSQENMKAKRFDLIRPLGRGGQGSVFLAKDNELQRFVAIKMLSAKTTAYHQTLLAEARVQAQIEHPNICKIFQVEQADIHNSNSYLVMQYIPGTSALTWLEHKQNTSVDEIVELMQKVCDGLRTMHASGIIHRDIKPANIMISKDGENGLQPFMVDFGLAGDNNQNSNSSSVAGTPAFMPPEQWQNTLLDSRSDVYSFGATLFQLLTKKLPQLNQLTREPVYEGNQWQSLPTDLKAIIKKCMHTQRHNRYPSARELNSDLMRFLNGEPVSCISSKSYWLKKKALKFRWQTSLFFVLIFGGIGTLVWQYYEEQQSQRREQIVADFTSSVEQLEADVRLTRMAPRHDITKKRRQWLQQITSLRQQMEVIGDEAYGPGQYAIGRMYYALRHYKEALYHLEKAWQSGFQQTRVAYNLAMSHGALYQQKTELAENIRSKSSRETQLAIIDKHHRQPAIEFLEKGMQGSPYQSYTKALLYYYQQQFDDALLALDNTADLPNWFYLHHLLRGDIYLAKATVASRINSSLDVQNFAQSALNEYNKAMENGRSDLYVHLKPLAVYMRLLNNSLYGKSSGFLETYGKAESQIDVAQIILPQNHLLLFEQGRFLSKKSDFEAQHSGDALATRERAIAKFSAALEQAPDKIDLLQASAWAQSKKIKLMQQRNMPVENLFQPALAIFERIPTSHRDYIFYNYAGFLHHERAKYLAGQSQTEDALSDDAIQSFKDAVNAYELGTAKRPRSIAAYLNMGSVLREWSRWLSPKGAKQKLTEAMSQYHKAAELNPEHFVVNFNMAQGYSSLSRVNAYSLESMEDALNKGNHYLQIAAKAYPDHPFILLESANLDTGRAIMQWQSGQPWMRHIEKAQKTLSAAIETSPDNVILLDGQSWIYMLQQQMRSFTPNNLNDARKNDEMAQALSITKQVKSKLHAAHYLLLLLKGDFKQITEQQLMSLPPDPDNQLAIAEWLSQSGRFEEAEMAFNAINNLFPAILWQYRLRHLLRWQETLTGEEQHKFDEINQLKALIKNHFPGLNSNLFS